MARRKHKHRTHRKHHKKGIPPYIAIAVLLIITVGASLSAFIWLSKVKEHVELPEGLTVESIDYDTNSHDMLIRLFNGNGEPLFIKTDGKVTEQTIITIYPPDASSIGCNFIPLSKLECNPSAGVCNGEIAPGKTGAIKLDGSRGECLITGSAGDQYHLDLRFGKKTETYADFMLE